MKSAFIIHLILITTIVNCQVTSESSKKIITRDTESKPVNKLAQDSSLILEQLAIKSTNLVARSVGCSSNDAKWIEDKAVIQPCQDTGTTDDIEQLSGIFEYINDDWLVMSFFLDVAESGSFRFLVFINDIGEWQRVGSAVNRGKYLGIFDLAGNGSKGILVNDTDAAGNYGKYVLYSIKKDRLNVEGEFGEYAFDPMVGGKKISLEIQEEEIVVKTKTQGRTEDGSIVSNEATDKYSHAEFLELFSINENN